MTTDPRIPDWLRQSLEATSPPGLDSDSAPQLPEDLEPRADDVPIPGEIRLAYWFVGDRRRGEFVLVLDVDMGSGSAQIALASADVDMSVSTDVLLSPERTGLPFAVVVETGLVGPVLFRDLSPEIGHRVPDELFEGIRAMALPRGWRAARWPDRVLPEKDPVVPAGLLGLEVTGPNDPLYAWVRERVGVLTAMTASCLDELANDRQVAAKADVGESAERLEQLDAPPAAAEDPVAALAELLVEMPLYGGGWIDSATGGLFTWDWFTDSTEEVKTELEGAGALRASPSDTPDARQYAYADSLSAFDPSLWTARQEGRCLEVIGPEMNGLRELPLGELDARLSGVLDPTLHLDDSSDHASVRVLVGVYVEPRLGNEPLDLEKSTFVLLTETAHGVVATHLLHAHGAAETNGPHGRMKPYAARLPFGLDELLGLDPVFSVVLKTASQG